MHSILKEVLGLGDISGFVNAVKEAKVDQNPDLLKRIQEGVLTIRDLYEQFQSVLKMGPMGKVFLCCPRVKNGYILCCLGIVHVSRNAGPYPQR